MQIEFLTENPFSVSPEWSTPLGFSVKNSIFMQNFFKMGAGMQSYFSCQVKFKKFQINFLNKFKIEKKENGEFILLNRESLKLPDYPSTINETLLYVTVACNQRHYPLITIRIKNNNFNLPEFINEPYEMSILKVFLQDF